jgi:hypothetical protein
VIGWVFFSLPSIADGAYYAPLKFTPAEARHKRKKYLDQRKMVRGGQVLASLGAFSASMGCGRFTQEYIEALKGLFAVGLG